MRSCKLNGLGLDQVKFQASAEHIDNVNLLALGQGCDADRHVIERIVLGGGNHPLSVFRND